MTQNRAFGAWVATLILVAGAAVGDDSPARRPVHTYSIVARDEASGAFGVAVQSHWFSVPAAGLLPSDDALLSRILEED